jgi:signal transduction histidine kinase
MFSAEAYSEIEQTTDSTSAVEFLWRQLAARHGYQAGLLIEVDLDHERYVAICGYNIPTAPFNGTEAPVLTELIQDCFRFPKAHVHAISQSPAVALVRRLSRNLEAITRVVFVPVAAYGRKFILLAFPTGTNNEKSISSALLADLDRLLFVIGNVESAEQNAARLKVTEFFVREVGHDIASSVQAIIGKLRTIRDGRVQEKDALKRKVIEMEKEINGTYGIADKLGLAIDPNYQLRSFADWDVVEVINRAIAQVSGEAQERKIGIQFTPTPRKLSLWGDEQAIQQCLVQLLMNAIKYSFGGTFIKVDLVDRQESIAVHVQNRGHPLPEGEEQKFIWDFGYRGKKAKELHVNGSGVGLFTVKKIVTAHRGRAWCTRHGEITQFSIDIPKRERLKSELGLLI